MDRAYEGDATRRLGRKLGYVLVVPPASRRRRPWSYDRQRYRRRNEVERLIRRLQGYRRVATRYDKLDALYLSFILFAHIHDATRSVNRP